MAFLSNLVRSGFESLTDTTSNCLINIGKKDKVTRSFICQLNKEEESLLNYAKQLSKQDPEFNEEPIKRLASCIAQRRQLVIQMLEDQIKESQHIYSTLDKKITYFDSATKKVSSNLTSFTDFNDKLDDNRKKRRRKSHSTVESQSTIDLQFEEEIEALVVDPSEPLYCHCKRISFGQMVACENPDCAIEWYHFSCVGLKVEPVDAWFCPTCRKAAAAAQLLAMPYVALTEGDTTSNPLLEFKA